MPLRADDVQSAQRNHFLVPALRFDGELVHQPAEYLARLEHFLGNVLVEADCVLDHHLVIARLTHFACAP